MGDFRIDEKSGVPIWMQLRNRIVYLIASGEYQPGDKLPTVREMAVEFGVNFNTVSKVYQSLERDGYIETRRGKGSFAAQPAREVESPVESLSYLADEFVAQCRKLGLSSAQIVELVQTSVSQD